MDEYYRDFRRNYQGSGNSGKVIITYSNGADEKPEITPITLNDSDERFIMLQDMVEKNIVMGHEIPPQLIILTPGKLGSTQERQELLVEFQQYYIEIRQQQMETQFNYVLSKIGFVKAARSCSKESPKCSTLYLAQVFGNIVEDSFDA